MNLAVYRELFVHRDDVFAEQQSSGAYFPVHRELGDIELHEHLAGVASYGVYVIRPLRTKVSRYSDGATVQEPEANTVSYVVFDLDTYTPEGFVKLVNCCSEFVRSTGADSRARRCLLAENSGGKGYHVWLFLDSPLPAAQVRQWVDHDFMPLWREVVGKFTGMFPLEVFPKQDTVSEARCEPCAARPGRANSGCPQCHGTGRVTGFGNLVKLPLGVHAKSGKRSEFVGVQGWASSVDEVVRLDSDLVPAYEAPPARDAVEAGSGLRTEDDLTPFACISKVLRDGAPSGCRDNAMFHLAAYIKGTGAPEDLALDWCLRVNNLFDPPLREREVRTKVKSAFKGNAPQATCKADWLEGFCPGGEHCFAPWNEDRPKRGRHEEDDRESYLRLTPEARRELRRQRRAG